MIGHRSGGGAARDVLAVTGTFVLLGAGCGVLWWVLVDPAAFTATRDGGLAMSELQLGRRFDSDGWYAVIAVVAGFLGGLGVTWWRSRDFRLTTFLLIPGSGLAAAAMAVVGLALGPPDPRTAMAVADPGQAVPLQLEVTAFPVYLLWPVAVLAGSLMVLWSTPRMPSHDDQPYLAEPTSPVSPGEQSQRTGPTGP